MRIVVKVGSSSITTPDGALDDAALSGLVGQLVDVGSRDVRPILVSSGAIAAGVGALGLHSRPTEMADLQALAAVGQGRLMAHYSRLLGQHGAVAAQVLLTGHDFGDRQAYLNARATLGKLLDWGVVPVVNENDTVATDEIRFGENDRLAALVAALVGASLLLVLTDTPGVFTGDPRLNAEASLIEEVASVDAELEAAAGLAAATGFGSGGMASKVAAAKIASWSGIPCVIAGANEPGVVDRAVKGEPVGTLIRPRVRRLAARKVWIAFAIAHRGKIVIDDGAAMAVTARGRSLLPVGVKAVEGSFEAGDAIEVLDLSGALVAKGLSAHSAETLRAVAGLRTLDLPDGVPDEAIHRDDMVVLAEPGGSAATGTPNERAARSDG